MMTPERVRRGIQRLMTAPKDVARWDEEAGDFMRSEVSMAYTVLFEQYRVALREAVAAALAVWQQELAGVAQESRSQKHAIREIWIRFPAGPASDPRLVALIRRYWLLCDGLNREQTTERMVTPEMFLLGWLVEEREMQLVSVLAGMPYWPMGLDAQGSWL